MKSILLRAVALALIFSLLSLTPPVRASGEGDDFRAADAELNKLYAKALAAMPSAAAKAKLREAQRAWVAFRDADMALNAALPGATGNLSLVHETDLTQDRIKEVKQLIDDVSGTESK